MGHREFGTNRWKFLLKAKHFIFRLCKHCESMICILILDHQFNRMHPWCSWECMLPGRCSPGKRCHTFWNRNIVLLPILLGKVSSVSKNTLCELYVVKCLGRIGMKLMELSCISQKMSMCFIFWCSFLVVHYIA